MTEHSHYAHGVPSWIDLSTPDLDGAKAFCTGLFGWAIDDAVDDDGHLIYTNFLLDGKLIAGAMTQPEDMAGMPALWNSYVNVDDAEQAAKAAEAAGGQILVPPMTVMETVGRMAFFTDPTGAAIGVWEAGDHKGAELTAVPGAYSWNELLTRDLEAAKAFYAEVFGWEYDTMDMPDGEYTVIRGDNGGNGGMMTMPDEIPAEVPAYWGVHFTIADLEESVATAAELGGEIIAGPMDIGVGRLAVVQHEAAGTFTLMEHAETD